MSIFDITLQLSKDSLERLIKSMHVAGSFRHFYTACYDNQFITIVINCPSVNLVEPIGNDGKIRAVITGKLLYHSRSVSDYSDLGYSASIDISVRARVNLTQPGDPALLTNCALTVDWSETQPTDIIIQSPITAAQANTIRLSLIEFIQAQPDWTYDVPNISFRNGNLNNGSFRFLNDGYRSAISAGLNFGTATKGSRGQLGPIFIQSDWGIMLNRSYVTHQLKNSIATSLGTLPAPHGNGRTQLLDTTVCTFSNPTPFGPRCLGFARQQVFLDSLDWQFFEGKISFSGQFSQITDSILSPPVSASFTFDCLLSLNSGNMTASFLEPEIEIHEWYANLLNSLTGGSIKSLIADAVNTSLNAINSQSGSGLVDFNAVSKFLAFGSVLNVPLSVTETSINVHPDGLTVQGTLHSGQIVKTPIAAFEIIPSGNDAHTIIFNAQASWCPGNTIVSYQWNFGDGHFETLSGAHQRFVTQHLFPTGTYEVTLTVTSSLGQTHWVKKQVTAGILEISRITPSPSNGDPWVLCETELTDLSFLVSSNGVPVRNAAMTLSSAHRTLTALSGENGVVTVTASRDDFYFQGNAGVLFAVGGCRVTIEKIGFDSVNQMLILSDCNHANEIQKFYDDIIKNSPLFDRTIYDPISPVLSKLSDERHNLAITLLKDALRASEVLLNTIQLTAQARDLKFVSALLGLQHEASESDLKQALKKRVEVITKMTQSKITEVLEMKLAKVTEKKPTSQEIIKKFRISTEKDLTKHS